MVSTHTDKARLFRSLHDAARPLALANAWDVASARVIEAAGADGIFVPGVTDPATVTELATAIPVPLNIMAVPGAPDLAALGRLGVARVSVGAGLAQTAYTATHRAARALYDTGDYHPLADVIPFPELDGMFPGTS
ncbi:isocitrate lyase/phosphoenolpyruvate mutase family protein [Streptomyces sp. LMG1-1-1.1]|uniref:isocitrate lyase/phosphoenolpyruvate mutase family protein n=1 Tax=Streptomyces sp. LMG1-1-1.1 TaxID=3135245 RepID=UPI0034670140